LEPHALGSGERENFSEIELGVLGVEEPLKRGRGFVVNKWLGTRLLGNSGGCWMRLVVDGDELGDG